MAQNLTDQQVVEVIRKILMRQSPGDWITADYLYAQLLAHPGRYGVEGPFGLPKLDKFRHVCKVMFETRGNGATLEVKVSWRPR